MRKTAIEIWARDILDMKYRGKDRKYGMLDAGRMRAAKVRITNVS